MYFQTSPSMQQPKVERLKLEVSETAVAELHAFYVDELEVEGYKKEKVAISIYVCPKPLYVQVKDIICHFKTPQWQRIIIFRHLSPDTYRPMEYDENDPEIAALCKLVIKKKDSWIN